MEKYHTNEYKQFLSNKANPITQSVKECKTGFSKPLAMGHLKKWNLSRK